MRISARVTIAFVLSGTPLAAQETKPVPKDSARVSISGCTKGYIFTAGPRSVEHPGSVDVPEGMHIRMNAPKQMIADIKAHEGSPIEITGLMKKGQYGPDGVAIGGGVRIAPGPAPNGGLSIGASTRQAFIDVEGWRPAVGQCPSR
jgi:hypothetical protein